MTDLSKVDLDASDEEEKRPEAVLQAYRSRLSILKKAQDYSRNGDIPKGVELYGQYLGILGTYFGTTEDKLDPVLFDPEKDLTELLLISHAYWELSKAYDRSPNLHLESVRCLNQFIKFTVGFKFQHVNAQMIRKFVKKKRAHNLKAFQAAYEKIQVEAKSCYVATYCYGFNDIKTQRLRKFKASIANIPMGLNFINFYYTMSPHLVCFLEKGGLFRVTIGKFLKSFLDIFLLFLRLLGK